MKQLLLILTLLFTFTLQAQEPPQLQVKDVVTHMRTIELVAADKTPVLLVDNNVEFIKIKNDSITRKGVVHIGVGGKLTRFYLNQKIELDNFRLPYTLEQVSAVPTTAKQPYSILVKRISTGDKIEQITNEDRSCTKQLSRIICRMVQVPDGHGGYYWVQQCRREYQTFWGHQYFQFKTITGLDEYKLTLFNDTSSVVDILFDIPKKQIFTLFQGECIIDYHGPEWEDYPY